jgi:peptide methionine sulfoxide reductase MsrA
VTEVKPAATFWKAEEYHQQYLAKRGLENCHLPPEISIGDNLKGQPKPV